MKKNSLLFFFLIIFAFLGIPFLSAEGLELDYPKMEEIKIGEETSLPEYIEYIFIFSVWAIGLVAFVSLVIGGIRWLTSLGDPAVKKDSKSQMLAALTGLVILLFSIIIIGKIDPNLLVLQDIEEVEEIDFTDIPETEEGPGRKLEIEYPEVGGLKPTRSDYGLPKYVKYVFNFAIWGVGFLVLVIIIIAGAQYLISIESPGMKKDSKDRISSALFGLLLLISSVIILDRIDLSLKELSPPEVGRPIVLGPGVWLCDEEIENFEPFMKGELELDKEERDEKIEEIREHCYRAEIKRNIPEEFEPEHVYIINPDETDPLGESFLQYAVVLHSQKNNMGICVFKKESGSVVIKTTDFKAKSVTPLLLREEAYGEGVTFFEDRDFEGESKGPFGYTGTGHSLIASEFVNMNPCYSMRVDKDEEWITVIYRGTKTQFDSWAHIADDARECDIFDRDQRNLEDKYVGEFCSSGFWWWSEKLPCVISARILRGQIIDE
jgi:hypothetical protein